MGRISKSLRFEVLTRDGFKCVYCGESSETTVLHVDHPKPRSAGGSDSYENLVTACADCNLGKGDRQFLKDGALTPDKRPARLARCKRVKGAHHILLKDIDWGEPGEDEGQSYLCLAWCNSCSQHETHYIPKRLLDAFHSDHEFSAWPGDPERVSPLRWDGHDF